ncbi:MAG: FixH family protein [Rhodomicrobium sp.]|nr:FixH family protein [Rhodomicrobium sp.]
MIAIAAFWLAAGAAAPEAEAGAKDYEFQPVIAEVKNGAASEIAVRLVHKPTGKPVAGAVLFRSRLDMSPENMAGMTAGLTAEPPSEPGLYRFKASTTMAGTWALKLMAKVPGESETVEGTVLLKAKD